MDITVVYAPRAREVIEVELLLPHGATVGQAIEHSQLLQNCTTQEVSALEFGVWGRKVQLDHALQAQDRVELYRPLQVDPKLARRARFKAQGAKSAGLFARRRAGAKAGY
jgi:putative ubiquitin-RnfH superfamily antitoxin RatB of RatAB toxin-antitoxin module